MPKPSFHHLDMINRGFLKCKLPTGKITVEENISSSAVQESQVSAQKTQNVHPLEEEMTSPHEHKHPHMTTYVQNQCLLPLRNVLFVSWLRTFMAG